MWPNIGLTTQFTIYHHLWCFCWTSILMLPYYWCQIKCICSQLFFGINWKLVSQTDTVHAAHYKDVTLYICGENMKHVHEEIQRTYLFTYGWFCLFDTLPDSFGSVTLLLVHQSVRDIRKGENNQFFPCTSVSSVLLISRLIRVCCGLGKDLAYRPPATDRVWRTKTGVRAKARIRQKWG